MIVTARQLRRLRSALLLALIVPQAACGAGWHRIEPPAPSTLPRRQQVEVWQGSHRLQLHAVRLADDSISGVPYIRPPECDSCRVSVPVAAVDSLRTGNPSTGFWKTVGVVFGGLVAAWIVGCAASESCYYE